MYHFRYFNKRNSFKSFDWLESEQKIRLAFPKLNGIVTNKEHSYATDVKLMQIFRVQSSRITQISDAIYCTATQQRFHWSGSNTIVLAWIFTKYDIKPSHIKFKRSMEALYCK